MTEKIFIGDSKLHVEQKEIKGSFVHIDNEKFYKIMNYDQMPPFFMSIVSPGDHWMFISSNGALTAGRKNKENALFPYYTVDKIHDSQDITGSKTIIFLNETSKKHLWEPFSDKYSFVYDIERNIYKNVLGNKLLFEEVNNDLKLVFRYKWVTGERFGFIRYAELENLSSKKVKISLLDGIQNILPALVNSDLQTNYGTLVDAYKKSELTDHGIGLYYLSSVPTDKAEPSEGLKANTVWSSGFKKSKTLLSSVQLLNFKRNAIVRTENDVRASRGAYFINAEIDLLPEENKGWYISGDVNKDLVDIAEISDLLNPASKVTELLKDDIANSTEKLKRIIEKADGIQVTGDELSTARHTANILFNIMRGGIFHDDSGIDTGNFRCHVENRNRKVFNNEQKFFDKLSDFIPYGDLLKKAYETEHADIIRLTYEYLPLVFSRRHGDPSRPWNEFLIKLKDENNKKIFSYEGNWRDIFQNWEALAMSFPAYIESMIVKFVNASTVDGYNPYRINDSGIDWEVIEPDNPWSNIGYWGDHQIIYLLKLLELSMKYKPGKIYDLLDKEIFCFADVPYKIRSYEEICKDPGNTIIFDHESQKRSDSFVPYEGSDAKLVSTSSGNIFLVNLFEKLLLTLFTKLSNFIPDAGIWLNTQRPEWNDANNALVGNGTSMVTVYYMRRYVKFLTNILNDFKEKEISVSKELMQFFIELNKAFEKYSPLLEKGFSDSRRKSFTDDVGEAGSLYRKLVYAGHSGLRENISLDKLKGFLKIILDYIVATIETNRRNDGLYHSYNLITFEQEENSIKIKRLQEMLEGQVAVLSSGCLSVKDSIKVLDSLKKSKMFRKDQYSYMLYPDRTLAKFIEKNNIPDSFSRNSELFDLLEKHNDRSLVLKDKNGVFHFNGKFRNAEDVKISLEKLSETGLEKPVLKEFDAILDLWEDMFKHSEFTGRSGTFFAYEGLGSIYWHMVSKLLLAVGEIYINASEANNDRYDLNKLVEYYYEIRAGIGLNKSPEIYGAFPIDPYSHTPAGKGAKQPGMTGQVKEDIISRFIELGVIVNDGQIEFNPLLLRRSEFLKHNELFSVLNGSENPVNIELNEGELAYTLCGIPVIYKLSEIEETELICNDRSIRIDSLKLDKEMSRSVFERENKIQRIIVYLNPKLD